MPSHPEPQLPVQPSLATPAADAGSAATPRPPASALEQQIAALLDSLIAATQPTSATSLPAERQRVLMRLVELVGQHERRGSSPRAASGTAVDSPPVDDAATADSVPQIAAARQHDSANRSLR